ncbi:MAG: Gfo/Idh/MocA family oxidoreductase [Granulicella sp.]
MKILARLALLVATVLSLTAVASRAQAAPVRVAIVGLVHGHAYGLMNALPKNKNVQLVGISEPNSKVADIYEKRYHLDHSLFYTDEDAMLKAVHPDAILVYTMIVDHRKAIEVAARHGVSSMVEKPLSTSLADALAIRKAATEHHVQVLVNYETTWYSSNEEAYRESEAGKLGILRKVVVHDGHEGPKEIGVGPEWLPWLTDPVQNGAGAMFDFGCYGADLMTLLMHGQAPTSVVAMAQTDKPDLYPKVDDDTTIIARYPGTQLVLMPSWNWSFARKDMEVYGTKGYAITVAQSHLRVRYAPQKEESVIEAPPLAPERSSSLDYLAAVMRKQIEPKGDLSSLDTNMVVMQILDAARESARTGRVVQIVPLPK